MAAPVGTLNGVGVNFAFAGTNGITISGVSGTLLQSADLSKIADMEATRDGQGAEVTHAWYNFHDQCTLEWVVTGTGAANAIANSSLTPSFSPGAFVTVSACTSMPELTASVWEVQTGAKHTKGNTNSSKFSIPINRYGGITAAAGA